MTLQHSNPLTPAKEQSANNQTQSTPEISVATPQLQHQPSFDLRDTQKPLTPRNLLYLQRTIGNQAVQRLLKERVTTTPPAPQPLLVDTPAQKPALQRQPASFNPFPPQNIRSGWSEVFTTWVNIEKKINEYKVLEANNYSDRRIKLNELKNLKQAWINEFNLKAQQTANKNGQIADLDKNRLGFLMGTLHDTIQSEETEVEAVKGGLAAVAGLTAVNPDLSRKAGNGKDGLTFNKNADIFNAAGEKIDTGQEGKICKIVGSWSDSDTTVKKDVYYKITAADQTNAGANYQAIAEGFVKKEDATEINLVEVANDLKYLQINDPYKFPLFAHPPTKDDVIQGGLGDCYLLAAVVSVINKNPQHFVNHIKDHGDGNVTVKLYQDVASPVNITIQKSVVVNRANNALAFASGAIWVMLLEKAYVAAGFHGNSASPLKTGQKSYGMIEGGGSDVALLHLTGQATEQSMVAPERAEIGGAVGDKVRQILRGLEEKIREGGKNPDPKLTQAYIDINMFVGDVESLTATVFFDSSKLDEALTKRNILPGSDADTLIREAILKPGEELLTGPLGSGKYGKAELELFNDVKQKIAAGKMISIGSKEKIYDSEEEITERGRSGNEPKVKGLVGQHAYTVLDYAPKGPIKDQALSIKLRNPWGDYGRKYQSKTGQKVDISSGNPWQGTPLADKDQGEFWIDVAELAAYFDRLYFTS